MIKKIRIGLFGFGKTGKAVANVLLRHPGVTLAWVVKGSDTLAHRSASEFLGIENAEKATIYPKNSISSGELLEQQPVDVIVDFSSQQGIMDYGEAAREKGTAIVSAISHYEEEQAVYLKELSAHTPVMWSPNITVGVNFLILASRILKKIAPNTDIEIIEEHFKQKPELSGTAKRIASALNVPIEAIKKIRAGGIVGKHEALFGFPSQTVRLTHESISREAFGNGALFAAQKIVGKPNGYYTMEDFLIPYFSLGRERVPELN